MKVYDDQGTESLEDQFNAPSARDEDLPLNHPSRSDSLKKREEDEASQNDGGQDDANSDEPSEEKKPGKNKDPEQQEEESLEDKLGRGYTEALEEDGLEDSGFYNKKGRG